MTSQRTQNRSESNPQTYLLDEQIGFVLRQVSQRHTTIFSQHIGNDLTPTQWAALAKLKEVGPCSQNLLGRLTAVDAATIKGVVDRLTKRGLVDTEPDPNDARRLIVKLTSDGLKTTKQAIPNAIEISDQTLKGLNARERKTLLSLLRRIV